MTSSLSHGNAQALKTITVIQNSVTDREEKNLVHLGQLLKNSHDIQGKTQQVWGLRKAVLVTTVCTEKCRGSNLKVCSLIHSLDTPVKQQTQPLLRISRQDREIVPRMQWWIHLSPPPSNYLLPFRATPTKQSDQDKLSASISKMPNTEAMRKQ